MNFSFQALSLTAETELPSTLLCQLDQWALLTCHGDDKKSYLQGQVTCDVVSLAQDQATLGAYCDAKGKMISLFHLFHYQDGYGLFLPRSIAESTLTELKKYGMFSKVNFELADVGLFGLMGENANEWLAQHSDNQSDVRALPFGQAVKIEENRWLIIAEEDALTPVAQDDVTLATGDLWALANIQAGMPALSPETQNNFIPQVLNLQALNGISFTKGCYRGQETVARAKYRGINKRALFLMEGTRQTPLENGAALQRAIEDQWRSGGTLINAVQYADGRAIALVVLPNDLPVETALRFEDEPENGWRIAPLPYSLDEA